MTDTTPQGNTCSLVDAVYLERETSVFGAMIDQLLDVLGDPDLIVTTPMVLDLIAIHWLAIDALRGQGYAAELIAQMDLDPRMEVRVR